MHVANEVRQRTWSQYPLLKVAAMKMTQLDSLQRRKPQQGKAYDKELAKIQSFISDARAPLTITDKL